VSSPRARHPSHRQSGSGDGGLVGAHAVSQFLSELARPASVATLATRVRVSLAPAEGQLPAARDRGARAGSVTRIQLQT
jgi:hypothetical protein